MCGPYTRDSEQQKQQSAASSVVLSRRELGAAVMAAGVAAAGAGADLVNPQPAAAVMGMTAGRVPGRESIHPGEIS